MNGFEAIHDVLERRQTPLKVFFRDDDAGWADERLQELLDDFSAGDLPLDIAVIPEALSDHSVALIDRALENQEKVCIHQHGFTHTNHQLSGRSSEFGSDRNYQQQKADIAAGQRKLASVFGKHLKPIFTPPWNRCSGDTAAVLHSLDVKFLSRIAGSEPLGSDITEISVSIDWLKKRKGAYLNHSEMVEYMGALLATEDTVVGVMLHHQQMDVDNRKSLQRFINVLRESQRVSFHSMMDVATH